ncbi:protein fuzzy homolog isoform X2 [Pan troglodytes]|nr:protein fuzzy homolog isoform X2 [Pan troglodytes]XP_055092528.1 protein fuzzy homolog isoform X4 [Symphalangus syndactylus]
MGEEGTGGTVHLLCLAASSGVPLFCRSSRGGAPARQQLPFSVIGSLNGVHMFGQNLEVQLSSARTENTTVVWKSFHDSITLIVLSSEVGISELRLERLLQMVFGAMVLLVGLEELTNIRNVERLKKDLRASYCLIDSFLGDSELIGDLTQCVDCVIPPEGSLLQVPHRLLTLTLLPSLELCLLCGPSPPLSQLYPQLLERWWQPLLDPLRACLPLGPRALPSGFPLHTDILGLLLLHLELKRCLFTVEPLGDKEPSPEQRRRLLRNFYTLVTSTHFPPEPGPPEKTEDEVYQAQLPRACYLVLGTEEPGTGVRLVALQLGLRRLLLLLSPQSPTHGLRSLATHTLHALTPLL